MSSWAVKNISGVKLESVCLDTYLMAFSVDYKYGSMQCPHGCGVRVCVF